MVNITLLSSHGAPHQLYTGRPSLCPASFVQRCNYCLLLVLLEPSVPAYLSHVVFLVKPKLHGVNFKDKLCTGNGDMVARRVMFVGLCYMKRKAMDASTGVRRIAASIIYF